MTQWEYLPMFIRAEAKGKEMKAFLADQVAETDERPRRFLPQAAIPELNTLGEQGWELLHMEPVAGVGRKGDVLFDGIGVRWSNIYFCVFKRQRPVEGDTPGPLADHPLGTQTVPQAQPPLDPIPADTAGSSAASTQTTGAVSPQTDEDGEEFYG